MASIPVISKQHCSYMQSQSHVFF